MTTQLFFRDEAVTTPYQFSTGNNDAPIGTGPWGATVGWTNKWLTTTRGAGVKTVTEASVASNTTGIEFPGTTADTVPCAWISAPLDQNITISGTITFNLWMGENTTSVNAGAMCVIERIGSTGAIVSTIANSAKGVELPKTSSIAAQNWTVTATSTNMLKGDRLRIRVLEKNVGTMGTDATGCTFTFSGTTGAASGDSYVQFTETFGFLTTDPSTTRLWTSARASQVDPGGASADSRELWTSGGGNTTGTLNSVNGWTAPIQMLGSGSVNLEWFSRMLFAFTLAAPVLIDVRGSENNSAGNAAFGADLSITDPDGTNATVWGQTIFPAEMSNASDGSNIFYISGADTAVTTGQRLRLRVFADDISTAAMGTGAALAITYGGTTDGAIYGTNLLFGQTVAESIGPYPYLVRAQAMSDTAYV